jgi:PAS domain S-box-containing protein
MKPAENRREPICFSADCPQFLESRSGLYNSSKQKTRFRERNRLSLAEEGFWRSVGRLRVIFEYSPIAHCLLDSSGAFIDVNEAAAKLLGYSRRELRGKKFSELNVLTPDQSAKLESSLKSGKPGEPSGPDEYIVSRKDRSQVFIEVQSFPVESGSQKLILAVLLDVSDRKLTELAFRFCSNLLDAVKQAVIATDLDGKVIFWNEFAETLYGWDVSEIIGTSILDTIPELASGIKAGTALKRLRRWETRSGEILVHRKNGTAFPAMVSSSPIRDPQRDLVGFAGISYDVTAQKEVRETLLRQQKDLRNFSRRILSIREEEKRRIAANIHREIGHITSALNLPGGSLEKNIMNNNLEAALESCRKFKSIFHDFISNLRRLALELRPPELDILGFTSAVSHYLSNIEKATGLKIELHSNVDEKKMGDDLPIVFFRIIQETINNILKHSQAKRVSVSLRTYRKKIGLAVKDDGKGFDPNKNKKNDESGMGLRLIKEMVETLEGTFEIHSSPGKGTRLLVSLPVEKPAERDSGLQAEAAGEAAPASESKPKPDPRGVKGKG